METLIFDQLPPVGEQNVSNLRSLPKTPTGIRGFDDITGGGLPRGRPTLVCGGAGSGKTLFGLEFLVQGAVQFDEPGVYIAFEETAEELTANVRSLGFDLDELVAQKRLALDYVQIDRGDVAESGSYSLYGLFLRAAHAISSVGAKRIFIDTIENLLGGLLDQDVVRSELRLLFRWLKDQGITAVITAERGEGSLTRRGLEEYVSDCVVLLDHRVIDEVATRRIRVVKYRGTTHGTNEYPFLISPRGIDVLPVSAMSLEHAAPIDRIPSGVDRLDTMLGGGGYYRGSSVMVSGTAGTGKSSLAAAFVDSVCRRGQRALYFAFEESPRQIIRNMRSIGIDLAPWVDQGLLRLHATRPTLFGLENHLAYIHEQVRDFEPQAMVVDPITNLNAVGGHADVKRMLMRLVDTLKDREITGLFTSLSNGGDTMELRDAGMASLIDTWMLIRAIELNGERNRALNILKSRGMAHSNQVRELVLSSEGLKLTDVYLGADGVLTGSARLSQEAKDLAAERSTAEDVEQKQRDVGMKCRAIDARIEALKAEHEAEEADLKRFLLGVQKREVKRVEVTEAMAKNRKADAQGEGTALVEGHYE
ncbi:circadian clock protein KaiC [Paludisphaera soli]|uniref:circadian clock protein KaiC n=1 Tax=Paludisphaera soli TaxID=2712865 RepID=UPI0013EC256B|nr:circadian clock protein KaiC [Paludisphaera soli]